MGGVGPAQARSRVDVPGVGGQANWEYCSRRGDSTCDGRKREVCRCESCLPQIQRIFVRVGRSMFGRVLWRGLGRSLVLKSAKRIPPNAKTAWGNYDLAAALPFEHQIRCSMRESPPCHIHTQLCFAQCLFSKGQEFRASPSLHSRQLCSLLCLSNCHWRRGSA